MGDKLTELKFSLSEKEDKLKSLAINTFTYNPEIDRLTQEILELKNEIKELEDKLNG